MPFYMFQWQYKDAQIKAMVENPQDRSDAARKAVEAHGGKLLHMFFAFGEYDGLAISEFPNNESAAAAVMTVAAGGGVAGLKTTVLISPVEASEAMRKAGAVQSGYAPPSG